MPSKQVVDRQKEAQAVLSAAATHTAELVKQLEALFVPLLHRGEKPLDLELMVALLVRTLQQSLTAMIDADDAYQNELLDDAAPRQQRDEAAAALRQRLIDLRDTLGGLFGSALVQSSGFGTTTPTDPTLLSRFAVGIIQALDGVKLPKPKLPGLTVNAKQLVTELDALRKNLDQALAEVSRETREAQATLSARNAAQAAFDERYTGVASLLSGFLRLAGKGDLADQVRLTWRRASSETSEEPPAEPAEPSPQDPPTK